MGSGAEILAQVDLSQTLTKKAYKPIKKAQLDRLYELETECFERGIPVIIVFEGWDAAGKGTSIRLLTERLDPRGFKVLSIQAPRTHEKQKPWLWRFWMDIPRRGQMAIFDRSWYGRVLVERVKGLTPIPDWIRAYEEINAFERTLADDGTVIVKFWLHIARDEQLRRFIALTEHPDTAWQVTAEDWENHRQYDEYTAALADMITSTNTDFAPWEIVPATSLAFRTYYIFSTLIRHLETALGLELTTWPTAAELMEEVESKGKAKKKKKAKAEAEAEEKESAGKGKKKQGTKKQTKTKQLKKDKEGKAGKEEKEPTRDEGAEAEVIQTEIPTAVAEPDGEERDAGDR